MKPANYGPFYAAGLYPKLAEVFRAHGYALAVHGSLANDFDLVAVPWIESASHPQEVAEDCNTKFAAKFSVANGDPRPHGRIAYKLNLSFADCALDVSFTPRAAVETKWSQERCTHGVRNEYRCWKCDPRTDVEQRSSRLDAAAATGNLDRYTAVVQSMLDEDDRGQSSEGESP